MNLANIIDGHDDDAVALISRNRATTYGDLRRHVAAFRGGLASIGVEAGDRVAIIVGNSPHFVVAYLATIGVGAIAVPLNPASPGPELESEVAAVGARVAVVDKLGAANWAQVDRASVPSVQTIVVTESADAADDVVVFDDLLAASPIDVVDVVDDDIRRVDVHQRHRRLAPSRDAHPRQPPSQPRSEPLR